MTHDESRKETIGKPKLHLVPTQVIRDIAAVREYGNNKYPKGGPDNWKTVDPIEYIDALNRHLLDEIENPGSVAADSGLTHVAHMACNIAFLCWFAEQKHQQREISHQLEMDLDPSYFFTQKEAQYERSIALPIQPTPGRHD